MKSYCVNIQRQEASILFAILIVPVLSFVFSMNLNAKNNWSLNADFPEEVSLPSQISDGNDVIWEFYSSSPYFNSSGWEDRQPHLFSLLNGAFTDTQNQISGFNSPSIDISPYYFRIGKDHVSGNIIIDGREKRIIGYRWIAPSTGVYQFTGTMSPVGYFSCKWAVDIIHNGMLTRNIRFGELTSDKGDNFHISGVALTAGDMCCISFGGEVDWEYGKFTSSLQVALTYKANIKTDFPSVATLPAIGCDNIEYPSWEYFGGTLVMSETSWQNRTPETIPLLNKSINEGSVHGFGHTALDVTPWNLRISVDEFEEELLFDGREYRILGARWTAPEDMEIDLTIAMGTPSFGSYRWAIDAILSGTRYYNLLSGIVSENDSGVVKNLTSFQVRKGDVVCLSTMSAGISNDYGKHTVDIFIASHSSPWLPDPDLCGINVDCSNLLTEVNRRVLGVGMIPASTSGLEPIAFPDQYLASVFPDLDGTSFRLWPAYSASFPSITLWNTYLPTINQALNVSGYVNTFMHKSWLGKDAEYHDETDSNLFSYQLPSSIARNVVMQLFPLGLNKWEVWNEPYFFQNGKWDPIQMGKYAIDCADRIHSVNSNVSVGVPLHDYDDGWNASMLHELFDNKPEAISFLVIHPYCTSNYWKNGQVGDYWGKVAGSQVMSKLRINPCMSTIRKFDLENRFDVIASEWNLHPENYSDTTLSTDMTAALHIPGMIDTFWKAGVDEAQFFNFFAHVSSLAVNPGFSLSKGGLDSGFKVNPTGEVMALYQKYARGRMASSEELFPEFAVKVQDTDVYVPMLLGHVFYNSFDQSNPELVLLITNRHRTSKAECVINVSNFQANTEIYTVKSIFTDITDEMNAIVDLSSFNMNKVNNPTLSVSLPARSVSAVILSGVAN